MTLKIIHKNNTSAGQAPTPSDLDIGEIAVNSADAELYTKDTSGNIRKFQNTTTGTADGVQFTQAGTSAVQRTVKSKLQDVVSVLDFIPQSEHAAIKDGTSTYDAATAIQAAVDAAYQRAINQQLAGSSTFVNAAPSVYFPSGRYLTTQAIDNDTNRYLSLVGDGTAVLIGSGTRSHNFLIGSNTRIFNVENLHFQNYDTVFDVATNNLDSSQWTFKRVRSEAVNLFIDSRTYDKSRSTDVSFYDCVFQYGVNQIAKLFCDQVSFYNCWIGSGSSSTNSIEVNSNVTFVGCLFIPAGTPASGRAAVLLTNSNGEGGTANDIMRGVSFYGCRMSNEGGQGPIVVADYPIPEANLLNASPAISFDSCRLVGFSQNPYESGNSESGIVYLKQWPASISFTGCSFRSGGSAYGYLVAKSDSLATSAPSTFKVSIDDSSYSNFLQQTGAVNTYRVAASLRGFIRNLDTYTVSNANESGYLKVISTATGGQKKASFRLNSGYNDPSYATPMVFLLALGGEGTSTLNDFAYTGSSLYVISIVGAFTTSKILRITYTKLHGDTYGASNSANCNVVSAHFGTGDTGSNTTSIVTGGVDVTIAFGTNIRTGSARLMPMFERLDRFNNQLH